MVTKFPSLYDVRLVYKLILERDQRFWPAILYMRLLTTIDETDPVHHEISESDKRWADGLDGRPAPTELRATFVPEDLRQAVSKFGGEQIRDVVLEASVPSLIAAGLATQDETTWAVNLLANAGDRFVFSGVDYEVLEIRPARFYGNTDISLSFFLHSTRRRQVANRQLM